MTGLRYTSKALTVFSASDTTWMASRKGPGVLKRSWLRIKRLPLLGKVGFVFIAPSIAGFAYWSFGKALYNWNERGTDLMFVEREVGPSSLDAEHFYIIEDWEQLKKSLSIGDVIAYTGTDDTSKRFIQNQYAALWLRSGAMKFSNVGVIVKPYDAKTGKGPFMLEASWNDEGIADYMGVVRRNQVQVVDASERLNATTSKLLKDEESATTASSDQWLRPSKAHFPRYKRAAARRLQGVNIGTRQFEEAIAAFVVANEGRPLDTCPFLPVAAISPSFYLKLWKLWTEKSNKAQGNHELSTTANMLLSRQTVGSGELIENLFEALGLVVKGTSTVQKANGPVTYEEKKALWREKRRAAQIASEEGNEDAPQRENTSSKTRRSPTTSIETLQHSSFYSLKNIGILPAHFANGLDARGSGRIIGESAFGRPTGPSSTDSRTERLPDMSSGSSRGGLRFVEGVGLAAEEAVSIRKWALWFQAEEDRLERVRK